MTPSFPVSLGTAFYMTRDTCDELEQQGFDILTYVDTSLRVTSISLPVSAGSKSLTALTQDITTTLVQAPDSSYQCVPQRLQPNMLKVQKLIPPKGSPRLNMPGREVKWQTPHKNGQPAWYLNAATKNSNHMPLLNCRCPKMATY